MNRKLLFFDIDGTLWDRWNRIPESTVRAIHAVQENGHLVFLNTGRSRAYICHPALLEIGFDGIISGCGTKIEYRGEDVYSRFIAPDLAEQTVKLLHQCGFCAILEGTEYLYFDEKEFEDDIFGKKIMAEIPERVKAIDDCWGEWKFGKFSFGILTGDCENGLPALREDFDLVIHDIPVVEVVPKGFSKGSGIRKICEILGADLKDTIAFGDSANDISMFQAAGTAVAMGDGSEMAKEAADYVTTGLMEDGIWNACVQLGLIEKNGDVGVK